MRSFDVPRLLDKITALYVSRQFALYVACGVVSTAVQLAARYVVGLQTSFEVAVLAAYVAGMVVALLLYRTFVFESRSGSLARQTVLFVTGYLAFLPVTWGISVGVAALLSPVWPREVARLVAHAVGVATPVALNFAFNKAVTFEGAAAPRGIATRRLLRTVLAQRGRARRVVSATAEPPRPALAVGAARCAHRSAE